MDRFLALVQKTHAARDDVAVFKHGIEHLQLGAENFVNHHNGQRLAGTVGGGQTVQLGLLVQHKGAVKQKVGGEVVVRGKQIHRGQAVVALAVGGVFECDMVERERRVLLRARRSVGIAGFVLVIQEGEIVAVADLFAVIHAFQLTGGQRAQQVAGVSGLQMEDVVFALIDHNAFSFSMKYAIHQHFTTSRICLSMHQCAEKRGMNLCIVVTTFAAPVREKCGQDLTKFGISFKIKLITT